MRGRRSHWKKGDLQDLLTEAILLNMPVSLGDDVAQGHESLAGLAVDSV